MLHLEDSHIGFPRENASFLAIADEVDPRFASVDREAISSNLDTVAIRVLKRNRDSALPVVER